MFDKIKEWFITPKISYIVFLIFQVGLVLSALAMQQVFPDANESKANLFQFVTYFSIAFLYATIEIWLVDKFILKSVDILDELKKGNMAVAMVISAIYITVAIIFAKG